MPTAASCGAGGCSGYGPISVTSGCKISPLEQGAVRVRGSFFLTAAARLVINRSASRPRNAPGKAQSMVPTANQDEARIPIS